MCYFPGVAGAIVRANLIVKSSKHDYDTIQSQPNVYLYAVRLMAEGLEGDWSNEPFVGEASEHRNSWQ